MNDTIIGNVRALTVPGDLGLLEEQWAAVAFFSSEE